MISDIDKLVSDTMTQRVIQDSIGFYRCDYSPHEPYERQNLFLSLREEKEVFYGGAAGGGKSDALLMAALEYVHVKGYAALLLRKTYADLSRPGALMARAQEWFQDTDARWIEKTKTYEFPSGATITFGYLESENDKYQYQSSEFQFIGFDELSQFTETQYTYLFSRLRRKAGVDVPLRMRSGSNPGGIGGNWVKARFIPEGFLPKDAEEARVWPKTYLDEETGQTKTRYFVPARLDDNPFLDQQAYEESLSELDPVTRAQLRRGDWSITAKGDILFMWDERYVIVPWSRFMAIFNLKDKRIPAHWKIGIFQDWGTTKDHPCVTGWFATASANSPRVNGVETAGLVFWYRTHIRIQASAKVLKDDIMNYMQPESEVHRCTFWEMSHEASSERLEYNTEDQESKIALPFACWETGKTRGIESFKSAITPIEKDKEHPFNPGIMGHTRLIILVDDAQYLSPTVQLDGLDAGQSRIRAEAPVYRWKVPKSGEPPAKIEPHSLFNDAIDVARGAAAVYFPDITSKSDSEDLRDRVKQALPGLDDQLSLRYQNNGVVELPEVAMSEGTQIAISVEMGRIFRQKQLEEDLGMSLQEAAELSYYYKVASPNLELNDSDFEDFNEDLLDLDGGW